MNFDQLALRQHFDQINRLKAAAYENGWFKPAVLNELSAVAEQIEPSEAYVEHLDSVVSTFAAEFLASDEFHGMHKNWATLDPHTAQKSYLQKCVNRIAELQGRCNITVSAGTVKYYHCNDPEYATDGFVGFNKVTYLRDMDDICINDALLSADINAGRSRPLRHTDLIVALQTAMHEQTHLFNLSLNTAYHYSHIDGSHPLHGEACYYYEHFGNNARIQSNYGEYADPQHNPYLRQLDERAAFRCGDSLRDKLSRGIEGIHQRNNTQVFPYQFVPMPALAVGGMHVR